MCDQHLYQSPAIEVCGHCRLLLPWLRVPCWSFLQSGIEKLLEWPGVWTVDLRFFYSVRCLWPVFWLKTTYLMDYWNLCQGSNTFQRPLDFFLHQLVEQPWWMIRILQTRSALNNKNMTEMNRCIHSKYQVWFKLTVERGEDSRLKLASSSAIITLCYVDKRHPLEKNSEKNPTI